MKNLVYENVTDSLRASHALSQPEKSVTNASESPEKEMVSQALDKKTRLPLFSGNLVF